MTHLARLKNYAPSLAMVAAFAGLRLVVAAMPANAAPGTGARIVSQGTNKGAVACARCHGYDGASDGSGAFPVLAGQSAYYLTAQLGSFATGSRQNAIMTSIARGLSDDEIQSVAQYYSSA